jgi:hypothetical protein
MKTATDARLEVLAAAVRAIAQTLTPEQASLASSLFLRYARSAEPVSDAADEAASAELVGVLSALGGRACACTGTPSSPG